MTTPPLSAVPVKAASIASIVGHRKILMLASEYPPARGLGLARFASELADGLAACDCEVHVVTCNVDATTPVVGAHPAPVVHCLPEALAVRHYHWVGDVVQQNLALLDHAGAVARQHGPFDLLISHDWLTAHTAQSLKAIHGFPWALYLHDTEHGKRSGVLDPQQQYIHDMEGWAIAHADHLITVSDFMRTEIATVHAVAPKRITVIPPGLNAERFHVVMNPPDFRAHFATADETLLLFVGRLSPVKGIDLLLDAMAELAVATETHDRREAPDAVQQMGVQANTPLDANPDAPVSSAHSRRTIKLLVAGDGVLRAQLEQRATQPDLHGRVLFLGPLGGLALGALYRVADLLVVPSRYEPFGMVALEAAAHGCPVLVHAVGGLADLAAAHPTALRATTADTPAALAAAIHASISVTPVVAELNWPKWPDLAHCLLESPNVKVGNPI